jgi:hypothetical protein
LSAGTRCRRATCQLCSFVRASTSTHTLLLLPACSCYLQVLRRCKGAFELVDVSDHLPGLRRLPGMQRWRVKDREGWYDTWEEGRQVRTGL